MPSFDIVSKVDAQALDNAVNVTKKEITNRFDFKNAHVVIDLNKKDFKLNLETDDDMKMRQLVDVLSNCSLVVTAVRSFRESEPTQIRCDDCVLFREMRNYPVPVEPRYWPAVQKNDSRSRATERIVIFHSVHPCRMMSDGRGARLPRRLGLGISAGDRSTNETDRAE